MGEAGAGAGEGGTSALKSVGFGCSFFSSASFAVSGVFQSTSNPPVVLSEFRHQMNVSWSPAEVRWSMRAAYHCPVAPAVVPPNSPNTTALPVLFAT